MIDDLNSSPLRGFLRPVLLLAGCVFAVALLLLPFAWGRTGSAGPVGLAIAGAVCLCAASVAEGLACLLQHRIAPLGVMLVGMAVRMVPPLGICLYMAAQGARGRENMTFIVYLLAFYLVMLALETWLTVKRVARGSAKLNTSSH
jgi:hypothetical protein